MKKKHRNSFIERLPYLVVGFIAFVTLFLNGESLPRVIVLESLFIIWFVLVKLSKSPVFSSALTSLLVLPFNITLTLPFLVDPYVRGVYSNYLSPTLHVLDVFLFILLVSLSSELFKGLGLKSTLRKIPIWLKLLVCALIVHLLLNLSFLSLLSVARSILYISTAFLFVRYLKRTKDFVVKYGKYFVSLTIILLITQLLIVVAQISKSADLGLQLIGESQILSGTIGTSFISLDSGVLLRGYGTFPHPNILAGYMLLNFLIALYFMAKGWMKTTIITFSLLTILLTFSRMAWLLVLLFLLIYVISKLKEIRTRVDTKSFSFFPLVFIDRIKSLFNAESSSITDRLELTNHSFGVIQHNWITGIGAGGYVSSMREVAVYTKRGLMLLEPVHNVFLLLISEYGLIGIFFTLGILFKITFINLRRVNLGLYFSILLFVLFIGLTDHYLISLPQGLAILVILLFL